MIRIFIALLTSFMLLQSGTYGQTPMEIVKRMFVKADSLEGFIAEIKKTERFNNAYIVQVSYVKLKRKPYQIYLRQVSPKEGVEVLIDTDSDNKKAVVNLNSFPWINLYLDPYGTLMRRNQHHTALDSGFDLMLKILKYELRDGLSDYKMTRKPDAYWKGRKMYALELLNDDYIIKEYKVTPEDDNLDIIADKLYINTYSIIDLNDDIDGYHDINPNQIIKVPSHYGKSMDLLIDQETHLPMVIKVYDNRGLYETYEYNSITINPSFMPNEFTEEFEEYDF